MLSYKQTQEQSIYYSLRNAVIIFVLKVAINQ